MRVKRGKRQTNIVPIWNFIKTCRYWCKHIAFTPTRMPAISILMFFHVLKSSFFITKKNHCKSSSWYYNLINHSCWIWRQIYGTNIVKEIIFISSETDSTNWYHHMNGIWYYKSKRIKYKKHKSLCTIITMFFLFLLFV